jgi:hypothetical protein
VNPWLYALYGACGGLALEAIQFSGAIRRTGNFPWETKGEPGPLPLFVSVVIRMGVGYLLAFAAVQSWREPMPLAVIAIGIAAPLLVEQMAKRLPLDAKGLIDQGGGGAR